MSFGFDNNAPIWLQIVEKYKSDIISGALKPGEKLPSVREGALIFKVNPNTVQRALQELEETGLIYTERTNGKFVTEDGALISSVKAEQAKWAARKFVLDMQTLGYTQDEIIELIKGEGNGTGQM